MHANELGQFSMAVILGWQEVNLSPPPLRVRSFAHLSGIPSASAIPPKAPRPRPNAHLITEELAQQVRGWAVEVLSSRKYRWRDHDEMESLANLTTALVCRCVAEDRLKGKIEHLARVTARNEAIRHFERIRNHVDAQMFDDIDPPAEDLIASSDLALVIEAEFERVAREMGKDEKLIRRAIALSGDGMPDEAIAVHLGQEPMTFLNLLNWFRATVRSRLQAQGIGPSGLNQ